MTNVEQLKPGMVKWGQGYNGRWWLGVDNYYDSVGAAEAANIIYGWCVGWYDEQRRRDKIMEGTVSDGFVAVVQIPAMASKEEADVIGQGGSEILGSTIELQVGGALWGGMKDICGSACQQGGRILQWWRRKRDQQYWVCWAKGGRLEPSWGSKEVNQSMEEHYDVGWLRYWGHTWYQMVWGAGPGELWKKKMKILSKLEGGGVSGGSQDVGGEWLANRMVESLIGWEEGQEADWVWLFRYWAMV